MNNELLEKCRTLKEELDNLPLFKEYYHLKEIIEHNEEISSLKKQIAIAKEENRIDDCNLLISKYNSNPLIVNYSNVRSEVVSYLKEISEIIQRKI